MHAHRVRTAAVAALVAAAACSHGGMFRSDAELAQKNGVPPAVSVPATTTREAQVRASPSDLAPVLSVVAAGTQVTASDQSVRGFRRIKTADGKSGYVEEGTISVGAASAPPAPPSASGS